MGSNYFIITVDTEGDNLWSWHEGEEIKTECTKYIPRFQKLCEKYGFKPVYLTNYEMAMDDDFVEMTKLWLAKGTCEIGIHLHAWNNPPEVTLDSIYTGNPYLIEYPDEVMRAKFDYLYNLIKKRFGVLPVSHRAGRWAMDKRYFKILENYNIRVDCSYTPGINWSVCKGANVGGSDYSSIKSKMTMIGRVKEIPMSIRKIHITDNGSLLSILKVLLFGKEAWLRPAVSSVFEMKRVLDKSINNTGFAEFMLHSSELMPSGSPYFKTQQSIELLYESMESIFAYARKRGCIGVLLKDIKI